MNRKHIFTRCFALILAIAATLSFSGCSKYREHKSSAADLKTVVTLGSYEVSYELYRYLFVNYVDALYTSPYDGATDGYASAIRATEEALRGLYGIYSAAEACGVDTNSLKIQDELETYMKETIDAYSSRSEYLKDLASCHSSDTIFRFLSVTDLVEEALFDLLYSNDNGYVDASEEAVMEYMMSDECYAYYMLEIYKDGSGESLDRANRLYDKALAASSASEFRKLYGNSISTYTDTIDGYLFYVGIGELEDKYENVILSLEVGEVSALIEDENSYFIFRRALKNASDASEDDAYVYMKTSYVNYAKRKMTESAGEALEVKYTDYSSLISSLEKELSD